MSGGFAQKGQRRRQRTIQNNLSSSNVMIPYISVLIHLMISFGKNKHSKLLDGSPCFTPIVELM